MDLHQTMEVSAGRPIVRSPRLGGVMLEVLATRPLSAPAPDLYVAGRAEAMQTDSEARQPAAAPAVDIVSPLCRATPSALLLACASAPAADGGELVADKAF